MEIFIDLHYEIIYKIQANKTKNHRNHCCYNPQPNPSYPNNLLPYIYFHTPPFLLKRQVCFLDISRLPWDRDRDGTLIGWVRHEGVIGWVGFEVGGNCRGRG